MLLKTYLMVQRKMNKNRHDWDFTQNVGLEKNILKDKVRLTEQYIRYMLIRTQEMFEYKNLPSSIPAREIELRLQTLRFVVWKRVNGELYVFFGGLGGVPNEYYQPTNAYVVSPYLRYSEVLDIDEDCVLMWNDSMHIGLMPMFEKNASLLAETDISLRYACVNSRILSLIQADNDTAKESAEIVLSDIDEGKKLGVIASNGLFEGIKTSAYGSETNSIKDLIELHQYVKASWYNDLGINSNYNMKREAINEEEASMNEDALLPLIDNMLKQRKEAIEKVNSMFGTNIEVDLSSSWKKIRKEIEVQEEMQQQVVEGNNEDDTTSGND